MEVCLDALVEGLDVPMEHNHEDPTQTSCVTVCEPDGSDWDDDDDDDGTGEL